MDRPERSAEYDTLRQELLSLHERMHSTWRWGLGALLGLLALILATLIDIRKQDPPSAELLRILTDLGFLIGTALNALAAGVSLSSVKLYFEIRDAMNRCGSYLAVFHDHPWRPTEGPPLGWHVWNRIEKFAPLKEINDLAPTPYLPFHGSPLLYPFLQAFLAFAVAALLSSIASTPFVPLLSVGVAASAATWLWATVRDKRGRQGATWWNHRWHELAKLTGEDLDQILAKAKLPAIGAPVPANTILERPKPPASLSDRASASAASQFKP